MRSVPISHSITGLLARSIGPGFTGAERGKALTNAGSLSGPPFGVHYIHQRDTPGLLPGTASRVHALAGLSEERSSLDRAEEWLGDSQVRGLPPLLGLGRRSVPGSPA